MFLRRPRDRHSPRARRDRVSPETPRNLIHRRDISPARHVRAHLQPRGRRRQGSRPLRPQEDLRPRASCDVGPPPRARGGGEGDRRRQKRPVPSRYPLRARTRRARLRGRSRGAALAPRHGLRQGEGRHQAHERHRIRRLDRSGQARPHRRRGPVLRLQSLGEDHLRIHRRHQDRRVPARVQKRHARVPPQAGRRTRRCVYFNLCMGN